MKSQKEIQESAKKTCLAELNMTESCLDDAVENVKIWLNHQPHLPHIIDSAVIRAFIVSCKSVEVAKERISEYFFCRINYPIELGERDPLNIRWAKVVPVVFLPDLTPEGYSVLFLKVPDLKECPDFEFLESIRYILMMWEIRVREYPYIKGQICITDLKNLSLKLAPKFSVSVLVNSVYLCESVYPCVLHHIYNINTPHVAEVMQRTLVKPFLSDGFNNMIYSYTEDASILVNHIPLEILPNDYGGKAPKLNTIMDDWKVKLEKNRHIFTDECSLLPDKSKIPKNWLEKSNSGTSGTFRKLNID